MTGLLIATPLIALGAVAMLVTSGLPVFFLQTRVGRHGEPFTLIKLRTMRANKSGPQVTARDDRRITTTGRWLRNTKLDELPQLWNILWGDMSFVGPRPEVPGYVDLADPAWQLVLRARPGLTDPVTLRLRDEETLIAAVQGDRDRYYREVLLPGKLRGYAGYLHRRSWLSDLRILAQTGLAVVCPPLARHIQAPGDLPE